MPHDQLSFDLVDGVHRHADNDQQGDDDGGPRNAIEQSALTRATGVIAGLGPFGYIAALYAIANMK